MQKEKTKQLSPDATRDIESTRMKLRDLKSAIEAGSTVAYEWVEDSIITKRSIVEFGKDEAGKETASVKMLNPETQKEEVIYFTTEKDEVERFRSIVAGETIVNNFFKKESPLTEPEE